MGTHSRRTQVNNVGSGFGSSLPVNRSFRRRRAGDETERPASTHRTLSVLPPAPGRPTEPRQRSQRPYSPPIPLFSDLKRKRGKMFTESGGNCEIQSVCLVKWLQYRCHHEELDGKSI